MENVIRCSVTVSPGGRDGQTETQRWERQTETDSTPLRSFYLLGWLTMCLISGTVKIFVSWCPFRLMTSLLMPSRWTKRLSELR